MKTTILRSLLLLSIMGGVSSSLSAFAVQDPELEGTEQHAMVKRYIDQKDLLFHENEIYAHVDQNWVQINAIYTDKNGLYFNDNQVGWECRNCHYWNNNEEYKYRCERCWVIRGKKR